VNGQSAMPFSFDWVAGPLVEMKQPEMGQNEIGVQVDRFFQPIHGFLELPLYLINEG
jgi:hypothetical protein